MAVFPKIKKKLSDFISKEEGKISKEKLVKTGVIVSAIALASIKTIEAGTHNGCPVNTAQGGTKVSGARSHCNELGWSGNDASHNHGAHTSY